MSYDTIKDRIESSSYTKQLWRKVQKIKYPTYTQKQIDEQYAKIEKILKRAIAHDEVITLGQIAQKIGTNKSIASARIKNSKKLTSMWNTILENRGYLPKDD